MSDVDALRREYVCKLSQHVRNILMCYRNSALCLADTCVTCRIVYGIADITVLHEVTDLLHCHDRTVILGLLGRSTKMWSCDNVWHLNNCRIREVCYILCNLSGLKCFLHIVIIYQKITGKV